MRYECSECGLAIVKVDDEFIRACYCNAAVVAQMRSTLSGGGGVQT